MIDPGKHHVRVPLTLSVVSSLLVAAASSGVTWGLYSSRLEAAEQRAQRAETAIEIAADKNTVQDVKIAIITTQYAEILRRLEGIEKKIDRR